MYEIEINESNIFVMFDDDTTEKEFYDHMIEFVETIIHMDYFNLAYISNSRESQGFRDLENIYTETELRTIKEKMDNSMEKCINFVELRDFYKDTKSDDGLYEIGKDEDDIIELPQSLKSYGVDNEYRVYTMESVNKIMNGEY